MQFLLTVRDDLTGKNDDAYSLRGSISKDDGSSLGGDSSVHKLFDSPLSARNLARMALAL